MASAPLPRNFNHKRAMELCQSDIAGSTSTERGGSEVASTGTPLVRDHLEEFFCVEQFTGWQGKFRLNLPGDLIRHIETHVGRQRTPPVQKRLDQRELL